MNILYYIHLLFPLAVIGLPLLPVKYLKYVFWYPILYYIIWYIFDGCPLTHVTPIDETNTDNDAFILQIFRRYINSNATTEQVNLITNIILTLAIVISAYKVIYSKPKCR